MSLARAAVGEVAAPDGDAGGAPPPTEPAAAQIAVAHVGAPESGLQAVRTTNDAPAVNDQLAGVAPTAAVARRSEAGGEPLASGAEDEEEKRRLARQLPGASGPPVNLSAESVSLPLASGGDNASEIQLAARPVNAARQSAERGAGASTGAPTAAGEIAPAAMGSVSAQTLTRSEAAQLPQERPQVATDGSNSSPARRAAAATTAAASNIEEIPETGPRSAVAQAEIDHLLTGGGQAPMARRSDDSLAVSVQATAGPGGIGVDYTPEVGINARQARTDSLNVQLRSARFLRTQVGGVPAVSTSAIVSSEAFSSRGARARGDQPAGGRGTPAPQTEEAIERGLAFLARYQLPDGGWSLQGFPEGAQLASDTAATALAVIAFQGAGYHHLEFQYKDVVQGGIDALVKGQKDNGDLFVPLDDASNRSVWLYSHSLAAIALCEAYGMTQDPELREPAQKAVRFIIAAQQPERGGWRYSPGVGADTSVSGWMMMALKSGELAGLDVPRQTYAKINRWLDDAQQSPTEPHLYRYNPFAPDSPEQRHGRTASKTMTAVGLLMRLYSGWQRDNPNMVRGAQFLGENLPAIGTERQPERDTYYWYYATQVMAHMGGEHWQQWIARLHPLLVDSQVREGVLAGSWDPAAPIPDRWGPHAGRLYVTTLNLLSLEVQYRKLPLYDEAIQ
jgi:hypothetical protein